MHACMHTRTFRRETKANGFCQARILPAMVPSTLSHHLQGGTARGVQTKAHLDQQSRERAVRIRPPVRHLVGRLRPVPCTPHPTPLPPLGTPPLPLYPGPWPPRGRLHAELAPHAAAHCLQHRTRRRLAREGDRRTEAACVTRRLAIPSPLGRPGDLGDR